MAKTAKQQTPILPGMGALIHDNGIGFRVWAPNANAVEAVGEFNSWKGDALEAEGEGIWYGFVKGAKVGQEYQYRVTCGEAVVNRIDPYARLLTHSAGNGVIYDPQEFDWEDDGRLEIDKQKLVIYEMHIGTFSGTFEGAMSRLPYLEALGVNAIELMPVTDFPGELSWGYNPAHVFAIETNYGPPDTFKAFVKEAHKRDIRIILDVVYNHLGPDDLCLWNFDGSDAEKGGPYFYPDERSSTPWGDTRPNYSCEQVRRFLRDNAVMWLEEYHVDGIRTDGTVYIRRDRGASEGTSDLPEGWTLMQWINHEMHSAQPRAITIAEDLQHDDFLTKPNEEGGAGFDAQWDPRMALPLRDMLASPDDAARSPGRVAELLPAGYNGDPFQSIRFTENHDEVAHGKSRIPSEIDPENPTSFWAKARSSLGAFLMLTAPGIPMLLQGQERFDDGWFSDDRPIDWSPQSRDRDLLHLYRDIIMLRTGRRDGAPGLHGPGLEIMGVHEDEGWLAYRRFHPEAEDPGSLVLVQMKSQDVTVSLTNVVDGTWVCHFASGPALHREAEDPAPVPCEGGQFQAFLPAYSVAVYSLE